MEQATLARRVFDDPRLSEDELKLLSQIASGVTADVAARKLELSARTLRRTPGAGRGACGHCKAGNGPRAHQRLADGIAREIVHEL